MDVWRNKNFYLDLLPESGKLVERKGHILWEHNKLPPLRGLKVLRSGWLLGTVNKGRFKPSQAFAMGLSVTESSQAKQNVNFSSADLEGINLAQRYLKGETIQLEGVKWNKGWYLVTIDNYPLGWAKSAQFTLKNEYPPGWRWVDGD